MDLEEFSDDELDTFTDETLRELEQHAIFSTQKTKNNASIADAGQQIKTHRVSGLNNNGSGNAYRPPSDKDGPHQQVKYVPPPTAPDPPSSDYGFDEEDVIDLDEPSIVIQPLSTLPTRARARLPAFNVPRHTSRPPLDAETEAAFAVADAELGAHKSSQRVTAPHLQPSVAKNADVSSLYARVAELEAEQARLRQSEQNAQRALLAKQGEISIVRANQEKETKEYERRLAAMQKLHADETTKQKAELDAGKKEREKIETNNRFLQHDLLQETERSKRLTGPGKARATAVAQGGETPRKINRFALGDGFDDDEVRMVSPSKSREKSRDQTPKVGAKRKRHAQESPVPALSFYEPMTSAQEESGAQPQPALTSKGRILADQKDGRYEFIQRVLNHTSGEGHGRIMEDLGRYFFPSNQSVSLSSMIFDDMSYQDLPSEEDNIALTLSRVLLKIWQRLLVEEHYSPLRLILNLIRFALHLEPSLTVSQLVEQAVPLCIKSIDLIALPIGRASTNSQYAASWDWDAHRRRGDEIDVDEIMDFLWDICEASTLSTDRIEVFWRTMEFTFSLLMLNKAQPLSQITTALRILSTSALQSSLGPICLDPEGQGLQERATIDRLTNWLSEMPDAPKGEPAYLEQEIAALRVEVLKVLKAICLTDYGGLQLAQNRAAIGRMIRFLDAQINKLYTVRPCIGLMPEQASLDTLPPTADLVARSINTTVLLLYHLLKTYDSAISLTSKTSAVKGGYHYFIISMTRIAFADQLVLDAGIETQTIEAAHTILDTVLSPEEGEAIVKAVETPRGTRTTGDVSHSGETTDKDTESGAEDLKMTDAG